MKKSLQKLSVMVLSGMLCLSTAPCAFAAGHGKSARKEYNQQIAEKRSELSALSTDSKELTQQVKAAQHTLKEAGLITKSNRGRLQELSQAIKAKRLELKELRGTNLAYRAESKEARLAGDIDDAADALREILNIRDAQIDLRMELVQLLDQKLSYIYSIQNGSVDEEESSTTEGATGIAGDSTTADSSIETPDAAANAETGTSDAAAKGTVTADAASVDTSADEIVTDEAELAAALDDGAELEDE